METIFSPESGLIFMKVGVHDGEPFEEILERKRREITDTGVSFWGYGGGTCHPLNQVQPFARLKIEEREKIYLVMEEIESHHAPTMKVARQYSSDGIIWKPIPKGVEVRGSRYAIILDEIRAGDLDLDLSHYVVGYGPSRGKMATEYIKGRVDKGCLQLKQDFIPDETTNEDIKKITHFGKMVDPYAVFVR